MEHRSGVSREVLRLRREYDALPKTPHGATYQERHPDIRPEWVAGIIGEPYDQ